MEFSTAIRWSTNLLYLGFFWWVFRTRQAQLADLRAKQARARNPLDRGMLDLDVAAFQLGTKALVGGGMAGFVIGVLVMQIFQVAPVGDDRPMFLATTMTGMALATVAAVQLLMGIYHRQHDANMTTRLKLFEVHLHDEAHKHWDTRATEFVERLATAVTTGRQKTPDESTAEAAKDSKSD